MSDKSGEVRKPLLDEEADSFKSDASMQGYDYGDKENKSCCSCLSSLCPPHILAMVILLLLVTMLIYA